MRPPRPWRQIPADLRATVVGVSGSTKYPFAVREAALFDGASKELPALALADRATDLLGRVLEASSVLEPPTESDDRQAQRKAAVFLGVLAARSLRAEMALLRIGYDAESLVFQRRLAEAQARLERVIDPVKGPQRARDWLRGQDRKPQAISGLPQGIWNEHSHPAHADHRAVREHLGRIGRDGIITWNVLPLRFAPGGNAVLVRDAILVRKFAARLARFVDHDITSELAELDADLRPAFDYVLAPRLDAVRQRHVR